MLNTRIDDIYPIITINIASQQMNQEEIEIRKDYIQIARTEIATHEEIEKMLDAANVSPACREQMRENIHAAIRTQNFYVELARF
jgi:hypothetical protein